MKIREIGEKTKNFFSEVGAVDQVRSIIVKNTEGVMHVLSENLGADFQVSSFQIVSTTFIVPHVI